MRNDDSGQTGADGRSGSSDTRRVGGDWQHGDRLLRFRVRFSDPEGQGFLGPAQLLMDATGIKVLGRVLKEQTRRRRKIANAWMSTVAYGFLALLIAAAFVAMSEPIGFAALAALGGAWPVTWIAIRNKCTIPHDRRWSWEEIETVRTVLPERPDDHSAELVFSDAGGSELVRCSCWPIVARRIADAIAHPAPARHSATSRRRGVSTPPSVFGPASSASPAPGPTTGRRADTKHWVYPAYILGLFVAVYLLWRRDGTSALQMAGVTVMGFGCGQLASSIVAGVCHRLSFAATRTAWMVAGLLAGEITILLVSASALLLSPAVRHDLLAAQPLADSLLVLHWPLVIWGAYIYETYDGEK